MNEDNIFMDRAIRLADLAEREGNLPVGAVIVFKGEDGQQAWVPLQYLMTKGGNGILKYSYNALELSVNPGEVLAVYEEINGFGMAEKADGTKGWVPLRNMFQQKG